MRDSEEFDGKRWIDSRSSLREPRQGFSLIKVPHCLQMDQSPEFIVSWKFLSRCRHQDSLPGADQGLVLLAPGKFMVSQNPNFFKKFSLSTNFLFKRQVLNGGEGESKVNWFQQIPDAREQLL